MGKKYSSHNRKVMNMKKIFVLVALVATYAWVSAQPRAIGLRLGYGVEASYQHQTSETNMVSLDLGMFGINGLEAACTYDWINPGGLDFSSVWSEKGEWNWYAGIGGALGGGWPSVKKVDGIRETYTSGFAGVAARLGVEYNFWFPLQLSIDYRPVLSMGLAMHTYHDTNLQNRSTDYSYGFYSGGLYAGAITLGVRYKF